MEVVVIWTDSAIEELQQIYEYYHNKAGDKTANKLVNKIVDLSIKLEKFPLMGQTEALLIHYKKDIRYLVQGNYKIVYMVQEDIVYVLTVFDCRQDPALLKRRKIQG